VCFYTLKQVLAMAAKRGNIEILDLALEAGANEVDTVHSATYAHTVQFTSYVFLSHPLRHYAKQRL
jgi:hypothetical protein